MMLKTITIGMFIGLAAVGAIGVKVCVAQEAHQCAPGDACCTVGKPSATTAGAPIACSLNSREMIERRDLIRGQLSSGASDVELEESQLSATFPAGHLEAVVEFIQLESDCCRFFTFTLSVPPQNADITLTIQGPAGSEAFLKSIANAMTTPKTEWFLT